MKKLLLLAAVAIIATAGFYGKNQKEEKECTDAERTMIEDVGVALAEKAVIEIEQTLQRQVDDYLESNDFDEMIGWSDEEKQQLTDSLQRYVTGYEWDTQELVELKDKVIKMLNDSEFLKSLKGITKEELDAKLVEILSGQ